MNAPTRNPVTNVAKEKVRTRAALGGESRVDSFEARFFAKSCVIKIRVENMQGDCMETAKKYLGRFLDREGLSASVVR